MEALKDLVATDRYLIDSNADLHEAMKMNHDYVTHKQWPEDQKQKLIRQKRPVLEIDITTPKLDTYSGIERNFRTGWKVAPTESNDEEQARLITALMIWHNRNHRIDTVASRAFKNGGTDGIGWIECYVKMGQDFIGQIVVRFESAFRMRFDRQTSEPDLSDCPLLSHDRWMMRENIEAMWPGTKLNKLTPDMTMSDISAAVSAESDDYPENLFDTDWIHANLDSQRQKRRVVDIHERRYKRNDYLLITQGPQTGQVINLENFFDKRFARVMWRLASVRAGKKVTVKSLHDIVELGKSVGFEGFSAFSKTDEEIWSVTFTGGTVLNEAKKSPYNHGQFPYIPSFAFLGEREDGLLRHSGIVEGLIGLQDEKNNNRSKISDIVNRAPLGGGWYNKNKGVDQKTIDGIHEPGAYVGLNGPPGETIEERDLKALPILQHFTDLEMRAEMDADKNSRVNLPLQGVASNSRESGIATQTRIKQAMMGLAEPLENHDLAKITLAKQIISNMQQFWPPAKIARIINGSDINVSPESINRFLSEFGTTEYDVTIEASKHFVRLSK